LKSLLNFTDMIKLIESFSKSKTADPDDCEDQFYIGDNFCVVADGVTSSNSSSVTGEKLGKIVARSIINSVSNFPRDITADRAIESIINHIPMEAESQGSWGAATAIVYSDFKREIWRIGDCQYYVGDRAYQHPMAVDDVLAAMRSLILEIEVQKGKSVTELRKHDIGREYIAPIINRQSVFENNFESKFGYTVINGEQFDPRMVEIIPIESIHEELVLATDGYPQLHATLEQSEKALSLLLETDPLLFKEYSATKGLSLHNHSFDDRAYLRFTI